MGYYNGMYLGEMRPLTVSEYCRMAKSLTRISLGDLL